MFNTCMYVWYHHVIYWPLLISFLLSDRVTGRFPIDPLYVFGALNSYEFQDTKKKRRRVVCVGLSVFLVRDEVVKTKRFKDSESSSSLSCYDLITYLPSSSANFPHRYRFSASYMNERTHEIESWWCKDLFEARHTYIPETRPANSRVRNGPLRQHLKINGDTGALLQQPMS